MFYMQARLDDFFEIAELVNEFGLEDHGHVQQVIDQTVIDFCGPYTPASPDRTLEFSAQAATDIGSGQVIWDTPYAHYQYMGIVYGPNIPIKQDGVLVGFFSPPGRPKSPTDRALTYDTSQNPMAGPYWFERMKADRMDDIIEAAQKALEGGV